jgi:hypothetical protein
MTPDVMLKLGLPAYLRQIREQSPRKSFFQRAADCYTLERFEPR